MPGGGNGKNQDSEQERDEINTGILKWDRETDLLGTEPKGSFLSFHS